jgi:HlyD family secretion protein
VALAQENLRVARNILEYTTKMFQKGYVGKLELDTNQYAVDHAELELALKQTEVDVLERFTKPKKLQELKSALEAAQAKLASDEAALKLEKERLDRLQQQRDACDVHADTAGIVIYPETEEWRDEPAIEEGSAVREQQTILQIPDLSKMQVKVGIHESKVRQLKAGLPAQIKVQNAYHAGEVVSVATQVSPTGWWEGNVRRFEAIVKLHGEPDVRPGMSAAVEITVGRHEDVLTIPVAAVVEQEQRFHCWVETNTGPAKRTLKLGDSNDQFIVVEDGVVEGERVVLNPLSSIQEAQQAALKPAGEK